MSQGQRADNSPPYLADGRGSMSFLPPRAARYNASMVSFALGLAFLAVLLLAARAFTHATVASIRRLLRWLLIVIGVVLAALLILSGRGTMLLGVLAFLGPMLFRGRGLPGFGPPPPPPPPPPRGNMNREEAYEVLGLRPGASEAEIRAAHRDLMRTAHPDHGGSDFQASRLNQARDILLG